MSRSPDPLAGKVEALIEYHHRVVQDFSRSLANSSHLIDIATKAMSREPDNAVTMVNEIKDIGLLSHLDDQFQEFQQMTSMLTAVPGEAQKIDTTEKFDEIKNEYEVLLGQAEEQIERIEEILNDLQNPH